MRLAERSSCGGLQVRARRENPAGHLCDSLADGQLERPGQGDEGKGQRPQGGHAIQLCLRRGQQLAQQVRPAQPFKDNHLAFVTPDHGGKKLPRDRE